MVGPTSTVEPVFTLTPLNLQAGVIDRSQQVPVVVLIGSPVAPGMSAVRRELATLATAANLRWILAVGDVDRHPRLVGAFRPESLPTVTVIAGGAGVATWTPADATGSAGGDGVDCGDFVEQVVSTVEGCLDGLPEDVVVGDGGMSEARDACMGPVPPDDPRIRGAAVLVGEGEPAAALALYDEMLAEQPDPMTLATLRRARAAVGVLERVGHLDRAAVTAALVDVRSAPDVDLDTLLRGADVLVLFDRPGEAVDLLSGYLGHLVASDRDLDRASQLELVRQRILEFINLLEQDAPAVARARRRIADAVF